MKKFRYDYHGKHYPHIFTERSEEVAAQAKINKEFWESFLAVTGNDLRSEADWAFASRLSMRWDTCACGSINDGLPRWGGKDWQPKDKHLSTLGIEFMSAIERKKLQNARNIFCAIQGRGAVVLAEQALVEKAP